MAITINKELNVVSTGVPPVIHLSQYDSDFSLVFSLYASSGTLTMPNGTTAEIRGTKRDGNGYSASASVSGTTVTVTGDEQITACAGRNTFEIATYYNSKRLYTANFIIDVERAALDADTITSDTVLRELDAIIEGAEVAQEAAEAAEHSAAEAAAVVQSGIAITALQLMSSNYTSDSTPYLYRTTGGGVAVGTREMDEVVGGSVGWNQLCNGSSVTVTSGHKYYMVKGGTASIGASTGSAITGLTSGTDMVTDLTLLLGSTIADYIYSLETATVGAGVAKLKEWGFFAEDYYAYDAGSLQSVTGVSAHETVGKNLLGDVEFGLYVENGVISHGSANDRFAKFIPVGNARNYIVRIDNLEGYKGSLFVTSFDKNMTYIRVEKSIYVNNITPPYTSSFTVHNDAVYLSISGYNATYNGGVAMIGTTAKIYIGISYDGEYEPYTKHTYPLDESLTLRGIPKLDSNNKLYYDGDVYQADGTVTRRYGIVDLGTLGWEAYTYSGVQYFRTDIAGLKQAASDSTPANVMAQGYVTSGSSSTPDRGVSVSNGLYGGKGRLYMHDSRYTTAQELEAAMNGVYLVYELATPTTETADPYASVQICAEGGTEEYVTTGIVPVGHNTKYPADLAGKLDSIPALPTTAGNYRLKVTVTGGVPSYTWESA